MIKKFSLTLFFVAIFTLAEAQELWMHPVKFRYHKGETLDVSFKTGDTFIGEPWDLNRAQLEKMTLYQNTKSVALRDSLREGRKNHLRVLLNSEGTCVLAMQTLRAVVEKTADEFNAYLKAHGLDEILDQRISSNAMAKPVKENYSRHTKLLFQVGPTLDETFKMTSGFSVEIIPEKNPYSLKIGDAVRFKILFDGKPVLGVRAKVWNRYDSRTTIQNIYTEKDGTFEARISNPGPWMVSVLRMIPSKSPDADWQSYWSTLVFGIEK